jgi:hypothetical protein
MRLSAKLAEHALNSDVLRLQEVRKLLPAGLKWSLTLLNAPDALIVRRFASSELLNVYDNKVAFDAVIML